MTTRIAALDGGTSYHHESLYGPRFARFFDATIYTPELPRADLSPYDMLIVTCRTSPNLMRAAHDKVQEFLADGRTLVLMGECRPDKWLPQVHWTWAPTNFWWWLEEGSGLGIRIAAPEHGLFNYLSLQDATWHIHGHFRVPNGATCLIEEPGKGAILYDDPATTPGRIIATCLDPFYHNGARFMPAATRFLEGFLPWLKDGAVP